ncbi:MAG: N-acetylmuramoyl-L-alanine amidase [Phycisphaerales bacterium]|nr:N-acetylmuramoyl-L-alanine amidase [Phycisphaerales bacterium]
MDSLNGTPSPDPQSESSPSRRLFVVAGTLFLAGCATGSKTVVSNLPDPWWSPTSTPKPTPAGPVPPTTIPLPSGVISRSAWAGGNPVPSRMDSNRPIKRITIHHDGMQPFTDTSYQAAANRLESIRRAHIKRKPQRFGDIGYHYAIDPAGRVWCCRPLTYQGAHVRGQNPGNLGIVVLGNYDKQTVNRAQQAALAAFLAAQTRQYRVPVSRIHTHQEMAATACPGRSLQKFMVKARRDGTIA